MGETEQRHGRENNYLRCFEMAMDRTDQLLREDDAAKDYERIHAVKSILYATIERAGMESERMISVQALLRELLIHVVLHADPVRKERQKAFELLEELKNCHQMS